MQIELPFLYKQRCLCSVCIFRVLHKYNNTVNYNFCADYWLWAQWELLIWKTLGCQFGLLIMSQYLYVVIKLFPINFCVGYLGVALRYLTVWSGSWWNNLFFFFFFSFHWFQPPKGFHWFICVNIETLRTHLRKTVSSLLCSQGWGS